MIFLGVCSQALLHSVPVGKLVVLDLFAEVKPIWITSEQFYGVPYIWKVIIHLIFINTDNNVHVDLVPLE